MCPEHIDLLVDLVFCPRRGPVAEQPAGKLDHAPEITFARGLPVDQQSHADGGELGVGENDHPHAVGRCDQLVVRECDRGRRTGARHNVPVELRLEHLSGEDSKHQYPSKDPFHCERSLILLCFSLGKVVQDGP